MRDVQRGTKILFGLKNQPLQIQTFAEAVAGSNKDIIIILYSGSYFGKLSIAIGSKIAIAPSWPDFSSYNSINIPTELNHPWRWYIDATGTILTIRLNGVEIFKCKFDEDQFYSTADFSAIEFSSLDTASSVYLPEECESAPAGFYLNIETRECRQCGKNEFSKGNTKECSTCIAGKISTDDHSECVACPGGNVRELGQSDCYVCDAGKQPNSQKSECGELSNIFKGVIKVMIY